MTLTKNQELYDLKAKLEGVNPSTLTELGQTDSDSLGILSSRIGGVLDSSSDDNWADDVKSGVSSAIGQIQGYISSGQAAANLISGACGPVTNLQTICNQYVEKYDKYVEEKNRNVEKYESEKDSNGNKVIRDEYIKWQQKLDAYEKTIPKIETDALRIKNAVKNYFAAVDLTTNTVNPDIYAEGSANLTMDYTDYFNGLMEVTASEWVGQTSTEYSVDDQGHIIEKVEGDHKTEFEDGSHIDAHRTEENTYNDINGDGKVDSTDELIYTKVHEEGTFTDKDGNVYGYVGDKEEDQIGIVHNEVTLTDQDTGSEVYHLEEEREYAGEDPVNSCDTVETATEVKTPESETCTWSTSSSMDGHTVKEEEYSFTLNADGTGEYVHPDGTRVRYYYGEDGTMHEQYVRPDGKIGSDYPVDDFEKKHFKIVKNGEVVVEYDVIPGNHLDEARMRYDLDQARTDCGTPPGSYDTYTEALTLLSTDPTTNSSGGAVGTDQDGNKYDYTWECL